MGSLPLEVDLRQEFEGKWLFREVVPGSTAEEWESETEKGGPPIYRGCIDEHVTSVGNWGSVLLGS